MENWYCYKKRKDTIIFSYFVLVLVHHIEVPEYMKKFSIRINCFHLVIIGRRQTICLLNWCKHYLMVHCRLLREKNPLITIMIIKNWVREYFNREKAFNNTSISLDRWRKRTKGSPIDYELKFTEHACKM